VSRTDAARIPLAGWPAAGPPRIGVTGDVVVGAAAEAAIGASIFAPALAAWARALDVLVVSFDATFPGDDPKPWRPLVFCGPRSLDALPRARDTVFNLATNHVFDGGAEGYLALRAALGARGVAALGAGLSRREAETPWIGDVGGASVALFAATHHGCHPRPPLPGGGEVASVESASWWTAIEHAARDGHMVLVYVHGGVQGSHYPSPRAIEISRRLAALGAAAVMWTHAHAVQGVVTVGRTLVAYGLGNLLHPPLAGDVHAPHADGAYDVGLLLELQPAPGRLAGAAGLLVRRHGLRVRPLAATPARRRWLARLGAATERPGYGLQWRWRRLTADVLRPLAAQVRGGAWRRARPRHAAALLARLGNARADAADV
jgi:poly-gamma-glutamate synthesis protein (capsule biosynthesis protein)